MLMRNLGALKFHAYDEIKNVKYELRRA